MHLSSSQIDLLPTKPNMTTVQADSQLVARLKALARAASLAVILVGGLVLFGWVFNIPAFKSFWPGLATMKANTALAFIMAGASLWLSGDKPTSTRRRLAQAGGVFVAVLAGLTLSQDLFGWNLGLDQLLFRDAPAVGSTASPGRMSPATAFNFTLLGSALLLLEVKWWQGWQAAQLLALAAGSIALLALVGYAYGVQSLYRLTPFSSMALYTAFTFFILALGILCARPGRGVMALITEQTIGGLILRRLLPAAIALPIVLGWVRLLGQHLGLYDTEMGLAVFALSNVIVFTGLIWWNARLLQRTDAERRRAEEQIHYQADLIENVSDAIIATDVNFNITTWNKAAETIYGWPIEEALGQPTTALLQTEFPEEQHEIILKRLFEGGKWAGEIIHRRKDGAAMHIFTSIALLKNSAGQPVGLVSVNRDISQRKRVEEQFRLVVEASPNAIILVDAAGAINLMNAQAENLFGYTRQELLGQPIERLMPSQFHAEHQGYRNIFLKTPTTRSMGMGRDLFGVRKDGSQVPIEIGLNPMTTSEGNFVLASIIDITERKRAEERFRLVVEASPQAIILVSTTGQINLVNTRAEALFGYTRAELLGQPIEMLVPPQFRAQHNHHRDAFFAAPATRAMGAGRDLFGLHKDGSQIPIEIGLNPITTNEGNFVLASVIDITMRQWLEEALRESEARYRRTLDNMLGSCQIIDFDWCYVYLNDAAARQGKRNQAELLGHTMMEMYPGIENTELFSVLRRCMTERSPEHMENKFIYPDGTVNWFELSIQPVPEGIFILSLDISERKQTEESLKQTTAELIRSNAELEQFAYIASHDLQEPLRAMASMLQLLQRRYGGQLDDRADEFIRHAVEGASRMQTLIADLLNFSRVGTRGQPLQPTDCAEVLTAVLANLTVAIRESQASLSHDPLPSVMADRTQLIQLFQNLLANAIKFRGDEAPVIHIGVEQQEGQCLFAVRDNGIGLEAEYFERVFGIFQRLHTRREYPGTGIGLAVCRKIVERHGGRIWVESKLGQGSVFYFTIPDRR